MIKKINTKLKLADVPDGNVSGSTPDSVLVQSTDGTVKKVTPSSLGGAGTTSLQGALDGGTSATKIGATAEVLAGTDNNRRIVFSTTNSDNSSTSTFQQNNGAINLSSFYTDLVNNSYSSLAVRQGVFRLTRGSNNFTTDVVIPNPTSTSIINFPADKSGLQTVAMVSDIVTVNPTLQTILNGGNSATFVGGQVNILGGVDNGRVTSFISKNNLTGESRLEGSIAVSNQVTAISMIKGSESYSVSLDEDDGVSLNRANNSTGQSLIVSLPNPTNTANIFFPANKSGSHTVAMLSDITGGSTNLTYTPSPTNGTIVSDTGTDATIPLATTTNAGLLSPQEKESISLPINLGTLVTDNFNRASLGTDYTANGTATWNIVSNKLRVAGIGAALSFANNLLYSKVSNSENYMARTKFTVNQSTAIDYGLAFAVQSIGTAYKASFYVLVDVSTGPGRGKLGVYSSNAANGSTYTLINQTTNALTINVGDEIEYIITRNKNRYLFEARANGSTVSYFMESSLLPGYDTTKVNNNICKFGFCKQDSGTGSSATATYDITYFNVERDLPKNRKFLFVGDSITFGYECGSIEGRFANLAFSYNDLKDKHVVYAQAGNTALDYVNNPAELSEFTSKYAIVMLGMNEAQTGVSLATFQSVYGGLVNTLLAQGKIPILCLITPNPNSGTDALIVSYNSWIKSNYGNTYLVIDTYGPMKSFGYNNTHPTAEANKALGMIIYNAIKNLI